MIDHSGRNVKSTTRYRVIILKITLFQLKKLNKPLLFTIPSIRTNFNVWWMLRNVYGLSWPWPNNRKLIYRYKFALIYNMSQWKLDRFELGVDTFMKTANLLDVSAYARMISLNIFCFLPKLRLNDFTFQKYHISL